MNISKRINKISEYQHTYSQKRILSQLKFALRLSENNDNQHDSIITQGIEALEKSILENGTITDQSANICEEILSRLSGEAKKITLHCVSHAHIDMNWMWGYNETVAITLDTLKTMVNLLSQYPEFKFSQSQASVYRIVEEHDPALFDKIKDLVRQGRWEITASTWVEADKNMISGESMARHILYTKRYLKDKFNLSDDKMLLDFEPDTFGHSSNVPEILNKGGVKYYFHCRGYEGHHIYEWKSPSGASIIVHREPDWYNTIIDYDFADFAPSFCKKNNVNRLLRVYGVGDHGGGPTRRDINILIDMQSWPCYPEIEFSTYHDYFTYLEEIKSQLPVVEGELNFIFTGCYSSQSKIKHANRLSEKSLFSGEAISAFSLFFANGISYNNQYKKAWEKTLFNQFHDILPGSGVMDTREQALSYRNEILGYVYAGRSRALSEIADCIDTSFVKTVPDKDSFSDGAGMGYRGIGDGNIIHSSKYDVAMCEQGCGITRIYHLFNTSQYEIKKTVEFPVWDWPGEKRDLLVKDYKGLKIPFYISKQENHFWAHTCFHITALVTVPPFGYNTLIVSEDEFSKVPMKMFSETVLTEKYNETILENDKLKVIFNVSMEIISFIDKESGKDMAGENAGSFSVIFQNHKMTTAMPGNSWVEGYAVKSENLNRSYPLFITGMERNSGIKSKITYYINYKNSKINVEVSLDEESSVLKYNVGVDWHEKFDRESGIPALKFDVPLKYSPEDYLYEIPFGKIKRPSLNHDAPTIGFMAAKNSENKRTVCLLSDSVYALRGEDNKISMTLLRASQYPDPYPEYGKHDYVIGIGVCNENELFKISETFNSTFHVFSGKSHEGKLKPEESFLNVSDNISVSCVKESESKEGIIIRIFENSGESGEGWIEFAGSSYCELNYVDVNENIIEKSFRKEKEKVYIEVKPCEVITMLYKKKVI